jgi:sugar (pentulose or hexulose) kinase
MHILAIDVGTSSVKAAVLEVSSTGPRGPVAKVDYELDHPTPEAAEVTTERLWNAVASAARTATRESSVNIDGIGLSCLTPGLVLLDEHAKPLSPIWIHLDRRSRPAARQIWAAVGEEFLASAGSRPLPGGISVVSWRQQLDQDPYLIRTVRSYLHVNGWIAFHMTGERAFDTANACFSGLFSTMTDQQWSDRWCEYFEVERQWLPKVVDGRATVGAMRPRVAAELGVSAGIPVKLGTADTSSAMLAARMEPGDLLHNVGTTQVLAAIVEKPKPDARRLTRLLGVGNRFVHVTHNPVGGAAFDWLRELCFRDQEPSEFFERTVPAAMNRETRISLDPPYLGGDRLEIEAHRASFRDLTLTTDRMDLLAALLSAVRLRHREAVAALGLGEKFRRVFLTGGAADIVRRLIPEYSGDVVHPLDDGSLRGVAQLFLD